MKIEKMVIHADGASLGNPGLAAIGATIKDEQGKLIASISRRIGRTTGNQAEYQALIAALEKAVELGAEKVEVNLDSQLVVRQVSGQYRVRKAALAPLYYRVKQLQDSLRSFTITHIRRQQNTEAHNLAGVALKS